MAKGTHIDPQEVYDTFDPRAVAKTMAEELVIIAVPMNTFQAINAAARARGISANELLNQAIMPFIADIDTNKEAV